MQDERFQPLAPCVPLRAWAPGRLTVRLRIESVQVAAPEIPMPGRDPLTSARVLERLVLQPGGMQAEIAAQPEQPLLVATHQMRHRFAAERVPMKPNAAVEGETHSLAAAREIPVGRV